MAKRNAGRANPPSRQVVAVASRWTGPLPAPESLAEFNAIIPDGAERIMRMAELEQAHRIAFEDTRLKLLAADTRRGHYIGGVIGALAIAASVGAV
ncbi:MAG: DUF2335 domain-containing protein [Candidatus Accumulibacter sp.]|jgi:uncharacterized membrane protein|nr:DUF2335 domain-containing protein [Accumulibacter sp.]